MWAARPVPLTKHKMNGIYKRHYTRKKTQFNVDSYLTELHRTSEMTLLRNTLSTYLSPFDVTSVLRLLESACSEMTLTNCAKCASFLSLLASTTEMDACTLMAATVHYASTLRVASNGNDGDDNASSSDSASSFSQLNDLLEKLSSSSLSPKSLRVAQDASLVRDVEHLAAIIVRSSSGVGPASSPSDAENLRHLLLSLDVHWRALAIRMVAKLHRLRESSLDDVNAVRRAREALYVYAPLAHRMGLSQLKSELEITTFRVLYPRQHSAVTALTAADSNAQQTVVSISEGMESVLADVTTRVKRRLMEDDVFLEQIENVSVTARVKEPFSLWRKILKNRRGTGSSTKKEESWTSSLSALSAHDAVALRVILTARKLDPGETDIITSAREAALCYHVINKCMERWPLEDETRYKDYIQYPKRNGYRSLHYSTKVRWRGEEWPFELQVRSGEMHHDAEYGDAAHCDYKVPNSGNDMRKRMPLDTSSGQYLKSVQEWQVRQRRQGNPTSTDAILAEEKGPYKRLQDECNKEPQMSSPLSVDNSLFIAAEAERRADRQRRRNERLSPYLQALATIRTDLAREHVFVFFETTSSLTSHDDGSGSDVSGSAAGAILSLTAGACVLDALHEAEKRKRFNVYRNRRHDEDVLVNGVLTSVTKRLRNADVLVIPGVVGSKRNAEDAEAGDSNKVRKELAMAFD
mmetsp:Transcript_7060/g.8795  ORF Transcript_7060/g.8795 Transcript_7060/m.8795 type:complete len:694 (-) Transcript_7060:205-2286(-)